MFGKTLQLTVFTKPNNMSILSKLVETF